MINKLLFSSTAIDSFAANIGLAGLRLFTGLSMAFAHGDGKTPPSEGFARGIADMGFPAPNWFAWAAGLSVFGGGLLIALGLMTRPASFFLGVTMFVRIHPTCIRSLYAEGKTLTVPCHHHVFHSGWRGTLQLGPSHPSGLDRPQQIGVANSPASGSPRNP